MGEASLTIPAEYVDLAKQAALAEVGITAEWVASTQEEAFGETDRRDLRLEDLHSAKRALDADMNVVDQVFAAEREATITADLETIAHVLETMVDKVIPPPRCRGVEQLADERRGRSSPVW